VSWGNSWIYLSFEAFWADMTSKVAVGRSVFVGFAVAVLVGVGGLVALGAGILVAVAVLAKPVAVRANCGSITKSDCVDSVCAAPKARKLKISGIAAIANPTPRTVFLTRFK